MPFSTRERAISLGQVSSVRVEHKTSLAGQASQFRLAVVVLLVVVVLGSLLYCTGMGWALYGRLFAERKNGVPGAGPVQSPTIRLAMQVSALSWKNAKVQTRTELPFCCRCCNTCCMQFAAPVFYIMLLTVIPRMILNKTGADQLLQVDHPVEFGRNYSKAEVWDRASHSLLDFLWMEPEEPGLDLIAWKAILQDPLSVAWHPWAGVPQGACFCRTLAVIGPQAEKFVRYLERSYIHWERGHPDKWTTVLTAQGGGINMRSQMRKLFGVQEEECPASNKRPLFRVFGSQGEVEAWFDRLDYGTVARDRSPKSGLDRICGMVVFENDASTEGIPKFTVRTNITGMDASGKVASKVVNEEKHGVQRYALGWYLQSGFLSLQDLAQNFIAEVRLGKSLYPPPVNFVPLPADPYKLDKFKQSQAEFIAADSTCTTMFASCVMTIAFFMIRERNSKQKELMRLMGLYDSSLALSWLLLYVVQNAVMCLGCSILVYATIVDNSDFLILYLIFFCTSMCITCIGMCVSALISSERLGALVAFGVSEILGLAIHGVVKDYHLPGTNGVKQSQAAYLGEDTSTSSHLYAASLIPAVAFVLSTRAYLALDRTPHGCTWRSLYRSIKNYNVGVGLTMLVVDFFLWGLLYLYLDQVVQHDVGTARPLYFPFTRRFWREMLASEGSTKTVGGHRAVGDQGGDPAGGAATCQAGDFFEDEESVHLKDLRSRECVIRAQQLCKEYRDAAGTVVRAVNGLDLTMYEGECFCLLGHNGAGKSTAMGMITGMLVPTSGEVTVLGKRMPDESLAIRSDMGFCMQQNVLWETLTVEEHVHLFGALMGFSSSVTTAACDTALARVELLHKQHAQAMALSGGMKRKLNVALALLGDSRVLILDEPTAGMDPHTRRQLWGVLKRSRAERIVCLTTHYMDEADELGDRVCIMVQGRSACCGTNGFLKQQLGCGYVLTFVRTQDTVPEEPIRQLVREHCGVEAGFGAAAGRELRVKVPFSCATAFPALMRQLDARLEDLGLESYGVGVSDLEDVFLRIANGETAQTVKSAVSGGHSRCSSLAPSLGAGAPSLGAASAEKPQARRAPQVTFARQFIALFQRRIRYGRRDRRTFCCQLLMPIIIMAVFLILCKTHMRGVGKYSPVTIDMGSWNEDHDGQHGQALVSVAASDQASEALARAWQRSKALQDVCKVEVNTSLRKMTMGRESLNRRRNVEELAFANYAYELSHADGLAPQFGGVLVSEDRLTFFPNTTASYSAPALLSLHFAAMMEVAQGEREGLPQRVEVSNKPLGTTEPERTMVSVFSGFGMGLVILTAYSFIATGIAAYVVMERELEVKNQLMVSGTGFIAYLSSNFAFDSVFGLFAFVNTIIIMVIFGTDEWLSFPNVKATVTLLLLFTPAVSVFAYFWSRFFETSGGALVGVLLFGLFLGTFGIDVSGALLMFPVTRHAGYWTLWIVEALLPSAGVGHGLMMLAMFKDFTKTTDVSPFAGFFFGTEYCSPFRGSMPCITQAGDDCMMLMLNTISYGSLVLLAEWFSANPSWKLRLFPQAASRCSKALPENEDEHVLAERHRVAQLDPSTQVLVVDSVHKEYPGGVHAVKGITYAVGGGQVFGLLGVNGAGKTTTFKMLCGQLSPTSGRILIRGKSIVEDVHGVRRLIGYCPQFDALLDLMTVEEHLELYAQVKGFSGDDMTAEVVEKLHMMDLVGFRQTRACQLSGGNKRKLSFAIAMVGEPEIIFLDEPSAGMDPVARRFMWDVIHGVAQRRPSSAIILTTHSMDEADALCTRIAIQCSGELRCLGCAQELKTWFSTGLELNLRLQTPSATEIRAACAMWQGDAGDQCPSSKANDLAEAYFGSRVPALAASGEGSGHVPVPRRERPALPTSGKADSISMGALAEWCLLQHRAEAAGAFLEERCGGPEHVERVDGAGGSLRYMLRGSCTGGGPLPYGELFAMLEDHRGALQLADFQISQGSLEQTFNRLASEDIERAGAQQTEE